MKFSLLKDSKVITFDLGSFYSKYTVDRDADIACAEKRITKTSFDIMRNCFARIGKSDFEYREQDLHTEIMRYKNSVTGVYGEHGYCLVVGSDYIRTFNTFRTEPDGDDKEIRTQVDPKGFDSGGHFPYTGVYETDPHADLDDTEIISVGIEYLNSDIISYDGKKKVFISSIEQLRDWARNSYPVIRVYGYQRIGHLRQMRLNEVLIDEFTRGAVGKYSEAIKRYESGININKDHVMVGKNSDKGTLYMCRRNSLLPIPKNLIRANSTARKFFRTENEIEQIKLKRSFC